MCNFTMVPKADSTVEQYTLKMHVYINFLLISIADAVFDTIKSVPNSNL